MKILTLWRNVGITSLSKSQYRARAPLEQKFGDATVFVEAQQYWFWNKGLVA